MTTFERFERAIPELMTEISPARVPDYFDDMLQQTAATRQRPAWTYLERWLPMGVLAQTVPVRPFPWRALTVLALLVLLIAAAMLAYVGSLPPRLPQPFGLARNGQILLGTSDGDIATVDPTTGAMSALITGPEEDFAPWLSNDGRRFLFVRKVDGGDAYFIANIDGSGVRQLVGPIVQWFEWSPTGDRIVVRHKVGGKTIVSVVEVATGVSTKLDLGIDILDPKWRPAHDQILFLSDVADVRGFYLVNPDGSGLRRLPTAKATINSPTLSPDGKSIAYTTWEAGIAGREGRTHILDIDTGNDREPPLPGSAGSTELSPRFSPDGTRLLIERYEAGTVGYRLVVAPIDGGPVTALGRSRPKFTEGASAIWSPDGTSVVVTYNNDHTTWLFAVDGSREERVSWPTAGDLTWQRLAP